MCDYYSNLTPTNMLPIYYESIILSADEMFGMWLDDMLRHVREDWTQNLLSEDLVLFLETTWSLSSDFNQPDVEVFILLGHDTAVLGNQLLTFQGNKMVSSSGFEMSKKNTIEQVDAWLYWDSVISDWLTAPSPHSLTCWLHHSTHQHYCPCPPHFTLPHGMIPVWDHFRCLCLCVCVCVCVYICRKIGVWMCVCVCIYIYIYIQEDGSVSWHKALCSKWCHILLGLSQSSGGGSFPSLAMISSLLYAICSLLSCLIVPVTFLLTQSLATITVHVHSSTCSLAFLLETSAVEYETSTLSWAQEQIPTDLVWFPPPPWCDNPWWARVSSLSRLHDHIQTHHTQ